MNEFILVSGVSEISSTSLNRTNVTSATGLQLLIDQDDTRLAVTTESIRRAVKEIGKHILRLTRQFATSERVLRMTGEGKRVELYYFSGSDISSDDVIFEVETNRRYRPRSGARSFSNCTTWGFWRTRTEKFPTRCDKRSWTLWGSAGWTTRADSPRCIRIRRRKKTGGF